MVHDSIVPIPFVPPDENGHLFAAPARVSTPFSVASETAHDVRRVCVYATLAIFLVVEGPHEIVLLQEILNIIVEFGEHRP
jgi:hypothetical protein